MTRETLTAAGNDLTRITHVAFILIHKQMFLLKDDDDNRLLVYKYDSD